MRFCLRNKCEVYFFFGGGGGSCYFSAYFIIFIKVFHNHSICTCMGLLKKLLDSSYFGRLKAYGRVKNIFSLLFEGVIWMNERLIVWQVCSAQYTPASSTGRLQCCPETSHHHRGLPERPWCVHKKVRAKLLHAELMSLVMLSEW